MVIRAVLERVRVHDESRYIQLSTIFGEVHLNFGRRESDTVKRNLAGLDRCHGHVHLVVRPSELDALAEVSNSFGKLRGRYLPPASYQEKDRDDVGVRYVLRSLPGRLDVVEGRLDAMGKPMLLMSDAFNIVVPDDVRDLLAGSGQ